jgi:C-type mannose receptor
MRSDGAWNDSECDVARKIVCECDPGYRAPPVRTCRAIANPFRHLGRMYFVQQTGTGWVEAAAACEAMDAYLAVPSDDTENEMLDDRFPATSWIGYSDRATRGTFEWVDGSPTSYLHFESDQPSNEPNQNCVGIALPDARWDDTDCAIQRPYACECEPLR